MKCVAGFVLAVALVAGVPVPGAAQQAPAKIPRIGILSPAASPSTKLFDAFREGLRDLGYIDGQNITIEYRLFAGDYSRLPAMTADLVRLPVDIIVADGTTIAKIVHDATRTIPIVIAAGGDPVAAGLAESLAHPGGNVTGVVLVLTEVSAKRAAPEGRIPGDLARSRAVGPGGSPVPHPRYRGGGKSLGRAAASD
ncbi:MAG TPA: ABC transporter substrate binding protein [Stellaceae bacterium]